MLTEICQVIRSSSIRERDSGWQGFSRCTCIRICKHGAAYSLQLAACSEIVELGQRDTIAPDARTNTRSPLQAHRLHAGVLYAQRGECRFWISVPFADKRRTYWHFTKASQQAPSTPEYSTIFMAGLIQLSCIRHSCNRKCKRDIHLSILSVALTFLSWHTCSIIRLK